MTHRPEHKPISSPVRVGKSGYQLFSETWPDGNIRFFAQVGVPYENSSSGRTGIVSKLYLESTSDFIRAAQDAESQLTTIRDSQRATAAPIQQPERTNVIALQKKTAQ